MPVTGHNARILIVCPECGGSGWVSTEEACTRCHGVGEMFVQPAAILALRAGVTFDTLCKRFEITPRQLAAYRANETRGTYDENGYPMRYDKTGKPVRQPAVTPAEKQAAILKAFAKLGLED